MELRNIREEPGYQRALLKLVPDAKRAEEIHEGSIVFFSCEAESGVRIEGTAVFTKTIPNIANDRYLTIFYTMTDTLVSLHDVKEFTVY